MPRSLNWVVGLPCELRNGWVSAINVFKIRPSPSGMYETSLVAIMCSLSYHAAYRPLVTPIDQLVRRSRIRKVCSNCGLPECLIICFIVEIAEGITPWGFSKQQCMIISRHPNKKRVGTVPNGEERGDVKKRVVDVSLF